MIISFTYGFEYNGQYIGYRKARDDNFDIFSPGEMVMKEVIREYFEKGFKVVDFGAGYEPYKERWATHNMDIINYTFPSDSVFCKLIYNIIRIKSNFRSSLKSNSTIYNFVKYLVGSGRKAGTANELGGYLQIERRWISGIWQPYHESS